MSTKKQKPVDHRLLWISFLIGFTPYEGVQHTIKKKKIRKNILKTKRRFSAELLTVSNMVKPCNKVELE